MSRAQTTETRAKIAAALRGKRRAVYHTLACANCSKPFEAAIKKARRFCCKGCACSFNARRENLSADTRNRLSQNAKERHAMNDGNIGFRTRKKFQSSFPEQLAEQFFTGAGIKFQREVRIGKWFADFLIGNVVVEIDGQQHLQPERRVKDAEKDKFLQSEGYAVYRISFTGPNESFWEQLEAVKICLHS